MGTGGRVSLGWVPFAVAVVSHAWVLGLPFQADDYLLVPKAGEFLGLESPPPADDPRADAQIGNTYLFRPAAWFLWWLLVQARGGLADPLVFHAAGLLLHGAAAVLLLRVLVRVFSRGAALAGAVLFAMAPGAAQATSYVAAGGDQLAVLFMLLATSQLQRDRARPSWGRAVAAGVFAALAFLSKDVAVASLPAALLAAAATPGPKPARPFRPVAVIVLAIALAAAARAAYLGTWKPVYLGAPNVGLANLRHLGGLFLELLAPWRRCEGLEDLAPASAGIFRGAAASGLRMAAAAAFCLPLVAGLVRRPWPLAARLAAIGVALALALAPALVIYHPPSTHVVSRALYAASAIAAAAVTAALHAGGASRVGRWVAAASLLPLVLLWSNLVRHVARTELRAGDVVRARLESMSDLARSVGPAARIVAVDEQFELGCVPLVYFGIGSAMQPPFSPPGLARVTWWGDLATLPRGGILQDHPGPVVVARITEGRYVEREPRIPALPGALPALSAMAGDAGFWSLSASVPARSLAAVRVAAADGGGFTCVWIGSRGRRETRGVLPGPGGAGEAIVSAPEDFDWLADPVLLGVALDGVAATRVSPLARLPEIAIESPVHGARLALGVPPVVTFRPPPQRRSEVYRLVIEFAVSQIERPVMVSEVFGHALGEAAGGLLALDVKLQSAASYHAPTPVAPEAFFARLAVAARASGSGLLPIALRVEGVDPRSGSVECRSPWRVAFLEAR
jgi:hypothetical protein